MLAPLKQALAHKRLLCYGVIFYMFFNSIFIALNTFVYRQQYSSPNVNNLCSQRNDTYDNAQSVPMEEFSHQDLQATCDALNREPLQFKKFIWYLTDGLPVKYSSGIFNHFRSNMHLYTIDLPGPKYSHAIYTSYLTGQLPTNYNGDWIRGDHLVKSIARSFGSEKLWYYGPEWSFLAIIGQEIYKSLFGKIEFREEPLDEPHDRGYRFFYKDEPTKRNFYDSILAELHRTGSSMIAHSAIFDHMNHGVFRVFPHPTSVLEDIAAKIASDTNELKAWIDEHPEYLLILSSDHGCDDTTNGYVLHGYSKDGNEGYVMMYNPLITGYHEKRMDVVDVAPTIAKYLYNVDIPSNNIGVTQAFTFPGANRHSRISALQQNVAQMADTTHRRGIAGSTLVKRVKSLLSMEEDQELLDSLFQTATDMKTKLYNYLLAPWVPFFFYLFVSIVVLVFVIYVYHGQGFSMFFKFDTFLTGLWYVLIFFIPLGFGVFINALFAWDTWKGVIATGGPFIVWHGMLTLSVFFLLVKSKRNDTLVDRGFFASMIDLVIFCINQLFNKQWKWLLAFPILSNTIPYFMLVLVIFVLTETTPLDYILFVFGAKKQNQKARIGHSIVGFLMAACIVLYEVTKDEATSNKYAHMYTFFGMHYFYVALLSLCVLHIVYVVLRLPDALHLIALPATMYAFILMKDTPQSRFLTILLCVQYMTSAIPFAVSVFDVKKKRVLHKETEEPSIYLPLLKQAMVLWLINQPLYWFVIGREEKLNVDAHPFAGAVGMKSHQSYPSFNAFQMAYEKWHFLLLASLFVWRVGALGKRTFTDMVITTYCWMISNAHWFLQLLLCLVTAYHPYEECVIYVVVFSILGSLFVLCTIWSQYYGLLLSCCCKKSVTDKLDGTTKRSKRESRENGGDVEDDDEEMILPLTSIEKRE